MASKKKLRRYLEVAPIKKKYPKCRYYFILGGRGTGKTFPTIKEAIKDSLDGKGVFAYIRRYKESLSRAAMTDLVSVHDDWLATYTNHQWNHIKYWERRFYLEKWDYDDDGNYVRIDKNPVPIGGCWAINTWEQDKGPDFGADKGGISNIIVDEVLSKGGQYFM